MLKKLLTLTLVLVGIMTLSACGGTDEPEGLTDLEKLAEALVELDLPATASSDLTFDAAGLHDVTITWESDNTDVIANDGTVTIPLFTDGDQTVTITAYVTIGENTLTKEFEVDVLAATVKTDAEKVAEAKVVLLIADTLVIADITLQDTALEAAITWASSHPDYLSTAGVVVRPSSDTGNVEVTLTATITVGDATDTKEFYITVQSEEPATVYTDIALMFTNAILGDYIEFTGIVTGVFDGGYFITDGTNALGIYPGNNDLSPTIGDQVKVRGFYAVYNTLYQLGDVVSEEVLTTGNANPLTATELTVAELLALDSSDPTIHGLYYTITGTIELQGTYNNIFIVTDDGQVLIYYYSLEASLDALELEVGKEVTITVFYYTNHGTNGPMVVFDGLTADITINTLPDADALAADVDALASEVPGVTLETIALPTVGANGTVFSAWTSSDVTVLGDDGTFVAVDTTTVVITFTGTATKGALTETVTVDVVVPLNSTVAEVLAMDLNDYFQVTGVIYDISYYGLFIEEGGNYIFVYYKQYDGAAVVGDSITLLGARNEYSGLAQIALIGDITINSSSNTIPTAVVSTSSAILNDLVPRGTIATITGTVGEDADNYDNIIITDAAGGVVTVYYRSNASEFDTVVGSIVTVEVISYQNGVVLYSLLLADITVETAFTDAQKAQMAADFIDLGTISAVEGDLTLPDANATAGATIVWASSDAAVVAIDGTVVRVSGSNTDVTLTATVTVGLQVITRDIVVTVIDADDIDYITVSEALAETDGANLLVQGVVIGTYLTYGDNEVVIQDTVTGEGIYVDFDVPGAVVGDLVIVRGDLETYDSYNNNKRQLDGGDLIQIVSSGNAVIVDAETDVAVIADEFAEMLVYTTTLTVKSFDTYGYVFFNGSATRDLNFSASTYAPYFEDVYAIGDTVVATFTVMDINYDNTRVVNVQLPALTEAQNMLAAKGAIMQPDTTTVDLDLAVALVDYNATIVWSSDNAAIGTDGTITRPANGAGDVAVVLTAEFTVGTTVESLTYNVTVLEESPPALPLFISEYIEGSSSNKAVEIYNPNGFDVVMTGYVLNAYNNGATDVTNSIDLSSYTILAGDVFVIYNSGAIQAILDEGDASSAVTYFNGNDAVQLALNGVTVDIIGLIGEDTIWTVGTGSTGENTLVRNPAVTTGVTVFDPTQWTVYDADVTTYLGSHTTD